MKNKILSLAFLLGLFVVFCWGHDITMLVLSEEGSPVEIVKFKWSNEIKFKNICDKKIEAIEFRILQFDPFNRYMTTQFNFVIFDKKKGKAIPPQEVKSKTWGQTELWDTGDYIEGTLYTNIVYVSNVRFADDSLWNANPDFITEKIKEIMGYDLSIIFSDYQSGINPWK